MSTTVGLKRIAGTWPRLATRITGIVYLLYFLTAIFGKLITDRGLVVLGDAVSLTATLLYIALTLLLFGIFSSVNRSVSLLAVFFSLLGCANDLLGLFQLVPFHVNSLVFFGPFDVLIGYLILKSTFLPRILGALMAFAGLGWLIFLSLPPAVDLATYVEVLGFLAEALLMLWLLVKGVNPQRREEPYRVNQEGMHK